MNTIWLKNSKYPGYLFSPEGNCLGKQGKILKQRIKKNGYNQWVLNGKDVLAHRAIAEIFCDNKKDLPQVNHIDGNKSNNNYKNLEWITVSDNQIHAYRNNLKSTTPRRGINSNFAKLTEKNVIKIKELIKDGLSNIEISKMFNVSRPNISMIKNNKTWKHITI